MMVNESDESEVVHRLLLFHRSGIHDYEHVSPVYDDWFHLDEEDPWLNATIPSKISMQMENDIYSSSSSSATTSSFYWLNVYF